MQRYFYFVFLIVSLFVSLVTIIHFLFAYFWFYCFEDQCDCLEEVKIYKNVMKEKNHFKFCHFDIGHVQCESNECGQDQYDHFKSVQDEHERFESGQDKYAHFESGQDQYERFESGNDQYEHSEISQDQYSTF